MLVTQSNYTQWQSLYGQSNTEVKGYPEEKSAKQINAGQTFSLESGKGESIRSKLANSVDEKSFLEEVFERTLNNRLGLDQGKMDELKDEIEKTQTAIEVLSKTKPHTDKQQKELNALENKLKKLEDALTELVRQATERSIENDKQDQKASHSINQYQSIASIF